MNSPNLSQSSATVRAPALWSVFAVLFGLFLLWDVYLWAQGRRELYESLLSAAMLLMSVAQLVEAKEGLLYKLLLLACAILLLANIVLFTLIEGA